jgi:hypothetical protein
MSERDTNEEAVRNVEKATDSEAVNGEELVESEDLKRYSKDLEIHKLAVALHFGVYNFVRKHKTARARRG